MVSSLVRTALKQRLIVVVIACIALGFGLDATRKLSVDAFPDVTNIQVQVATEVPGRSPDEVERMVTVPVEIGMTGLPGMTEMRSQNEPGLSIVTLVFFFLCTSFVQLRVISGKAFDGGFQFPCLHAGQH